MTPAENRPRRGRSSLISTLFLTILLNGSACGKIGPLSLSERPVPLAIQDIRLEQRQNTILLSWTFPKTMKDKKTPFSLEQLQYVEIWHTDRPTLDKPFRKLAKRMKRIPAKELKPDKEGSCTIELPFKLEELDSKTHHFALRYRYQKQETDLGRRVSHQAVLPARSVQDLSLLEEGRHIILKWSRPEQNIADKPLKELIGYQIYRQKKSGGDWEEEKPVNKEIVLREGYEEEKSDSEGEYRYRVTALSSPTIESDFSNPAAIRLVDDTAPKAPANLVCLSYEKHLWLTWESPKDNDLDQFRIFRKQSHVEPFTLLAEGVKISSYRDYKVRRGQSYYYLVTAVDRKGNESRQSNMAEGKLE